MYAMLSPHIAAAWFAATAACFTLQSAAVQDAMLSNASPASSMQRVSTITQGAAASALLVMLLLLLLLDWSTASAIAYATCPTHLAEPMSQLLLPCSA
jgi:hypothetical protein